MARYCGLFDESVAPQLSAMLMQPAVKKFLTMWGEALQMAYELSVKFAPETIEKVTGNAPSEDLDVFHYVMHFDAGQFQPELMDAKLKAFSDLAATDSTGSVDQSALTRMKARMIDPGMAKELLIDKGQASTKIFKDVQNDILNMYAGSEAQYGDASNDPAAPTKLQYAMQILQGNPNYLNAIDPQLVQKMMPGPQGRADGATDRAATAAVGREAGCAVQCAVGKLFEEFATGREPAAEQAGGTDGSEEADVMLNRRWTQINADKNIFMNPDLLFALVIVLTASGFTGVGMMIERVKLHRVRVKLVVALCEVERLKGELHRYRSRGRQ